MTQQNVAIFGSGEAGTLRQLGTRLAKGREVSDSLFTGIGARMQACATVLNGITHAFEALPRELQSEELTDATVRLADLGGRASAITAAFGLESASLSELLETIAAVADPVIDLDKTTRLLGILALNAHVVAADSDSRTTGLATIAQEASHLSYNAAESIKVFRSAYARLAETVKKAVRQQAEFEGRHRGTLTDLAAGIEGKLGKLERHRAKSVGALGQTALLTREVSSGVAQAVMALQIGDATHQRLSHIEQALDMVEQMIVTGASGGLSVSCENRPLVAGQVLLLQQRQLDDARAHLDGNGDALRAAFDQLAIRTAEIVQQGKAVGDGDGDQQGSVLADLSAEVRAAGTVLRTYERERRKLDSVASTVRSTADDLLKQVETVRRIEHSMRLLSFNATVRCAQQEVDTGGFDVIAQQLREITMRLVGSANAAMQGLARAAELAATFIRNSSSAGADRVGEMESEAGHAIGLLESVEGRLDGALAALALQGPRAVQDLKAAAAAFGEAKALSVLMDEAASEIAAVPFVKAAPALTAKGPSADVLAALRCAYTMGAERKVHDAMVMADNTVPGEAETMTVSERLDDEVIFF